MAGASPRAANRTRSEEHTSELQSRVDLVCRLLLEKKNTGQQHLLQFGACDADAGTHFAPQLLQVGVVEYLPLLVKKAQAAHDHPSLPDRLAQTEHPCRADAVGMHQDACPCCVPGGTALNELGPEALLVQGRGQSEPSNPSAHNQNPFHLGHFFFLTPRRPPRSTLFPYTTLFR